MNTSASTSTAGRHATQRPWWLELFLADFRNALLPWLLYTAAVLALGWENFQPHIYEQVLMIIIMLIAPAVVTTVFCSDFSHATMASLLSFPLNRRQVWIVRCAGVALLLFLPYFFTTALVLISRIQGGLKHYPQMALFTYIHICAGAMLSLVLRKALLVWSGTLISPLVLLLVFLIIRHLFQFEWGRYSTPDFPWMPLDFTVFGLAASTLLLFIVSRKWLRLEVSQ